ncbi:MAG TPA: tRNA (adenosine(37)-N6)-threonylcarbamoyltransferase complex transferase subunit TsaD [Bacteroidales bacterium]|nr:tRNA (adenosine(37)-N6)-threonylcarbamoyltransferase complex transferase subunit TsaD [Bacteroidales bacterium]HPS18140.1 tRNA (adenosine(37)-N6)-threonylcarbamoyltransferase complex transferase subunit TsaD [Bacteroidales bacterium]
MSIYILGIESSCDDTSAAVLDETHLLSNITANQDVHKKYGGVVPELASRSHQANIIPVVDSALKHANISKNQLNAIAFTNGPGLLGSLLVGASFAKAFALGLNIPLIEIDHIHAHILANFIQTKNKKDVPEFPFLCLLVSGGHTMIAKVSDYFKIEILGHTIDDAAGEAFDKSAKILGLPYPGGPMIDKYAVTGNSGMYKFPHPAIKGLDYSFSGLKTSILYFLRDQMIKDNSFIEKNINDLCASIQKTIIDILLKKLEKAVKETGINEIAIAGGVSANTALREAIIKRKETHQWKIHIPPFEFCTDNAAMIAITGYYKYAINEFSSQRTSPYSRIKK